MSPLLPARGAETFADLVDRPDAVAAGRGERFGGLLELVAELREVPQPPPPRPAFVAELRERLMAEADTVLLPLKGEDRRTVVVSPAAHRRNRRLAVVVGTAAAVGATSSMAVAAQGALPGSSLYPVKQLIERAQLTFAGSDADEGIQLLANARDRLDETTALVAEDERPEAVPGTLDDFSSQARRGADLLLADFEQAGRESSVERINEFTAGAILELQALDGAVPAEADDELAEAGRTLLEIDADARAACPLCEGGGITEMPQFLLAAEAISGEDLLAELRDRADREREGRTDVVPTALPSVEPSGLPTRLPTTDPSQAPTSEPTQLPTDLTSQLPTQNPSGNPTRLPTRSPTQVPTLLPTALPTLLPTALPTLLPTQLPSVLPSLIDPVTSLLTGIPTLLPGQGQSGLLGQVGQVGEGVRGTVEGTVEGTLDGVDGLLGGGRR